MIKALYYNFNEPNSEGARWLRYIDGECFVDDKPLRITDATEWVLVTSRTTPEAFCGWRPVGKYGFHARAGVLPAARRQGLQGFMLELREEAMRRAGLIDAVTYTEAHGVASMRSLMKAGYKPFEPDEQLWRRIVISLERRHQMVYWKKRL